MSITSSTDICNLALDLLSAGIIEDVENPTNATEQLLNRWYGLCRKKLLREHPWNFAAKRAVLAASATVPTFGYTKAFPVPADFIRILYISTNLVSDQDTYLPTDAYQFESRSILTSGDYGDGTSLNLVYVQDFTNVSQMDPLFLDLLAHDIALNIAYRVTETNTNVQRLGEIRERRASLAKAIDGQERPPQNIQRSRSKYARRSGRGEMHRITF